MTPGLAFSLLSLVGVVAVAVRARLLRGRFFAIFSGLVTSLQSAIAAVIFEALGPLQILAFALQILTFVHFWRLARPRMRPDWDRALIGIPAMWWSAGALLAFPWALAMGLGFDPWLPWLPWLVALTGVPLSLQERIEDVDLVLTGEPVRQLSRLNTSFRRARTPLTVVQITDPHLGSFMSVERLRAICQRAVERQPDLILLTGDYLTMESSETRGALAEALAPLKTLPGQVFAIRGNHDHEAPEEVASALEANGIRLLIDECALVETAAGTVQILGIDHRWRGVREALGRITDTFPRIPGALRVLLLHDPGQFKLVPEGEADLVLSGHTHGGQVGLLSLGSSWTALSGAKGLPDHGFWGLGSNRLYVHRGHGHYGYPLRIGVPPEDGLLRIHAMAER